MARKIIIDTDPGQDDAVGILLALACPDQIDLLGITTVAGNVPLELTTRNARTTCELAGRPDIPLHAGCDRPLQRPLRTAEYIHGGTGLDGHDLPAPTMPVQEAHAVDFLIDTLRREEPGTVTLCTMGMLTNIATAFTRAPDIVPRVAGIVAMGGAYFEVGNYTPAAEFNIYNDPEAAEIVLQAGRPVTLVPLDVTHKALATPERLAALRAAGTRVCDVVADWIGFFERHDMEKYGSPGGPLHDPLVIAWLLWPELFSGREINVEIETGSELTLGMTVADWWRVTDRPANALFLGDLDADAFYARLTEKLATL
ncbi:nucleoside hydrolase [Pseudoponticoccus marisrubri]|uniref:Nucleoside hydrolase n=1 Tax=Pseudoponticoccus marisrubri TaxID=1685382 RepID=A0A0W7WPF4_9RHOB|nr:nucleoside hydrolase [Pseudoponticoccus marisrubri]KUF12391.1 nucleoside hydrolase [Pseudoponticoccus marisrubri]